MGALARSRARPDQPGRTRTAEAPRLSAPYEGSGRRRTRRTPSETRLLCACSTIRTKTRRSCDSPTTEMVGATDGVRVRRRHLAGPRGVAREACTPVHRQPLLRVEEQFLAPHVGQGEAELTAHALPGDVLDDRDGPDGPPVRAVRLVVLLGDGDQLARQVTRPSPRSCASVAGERPFPCDGSARRNGTRIKA